jgi:hypothetical protein
MSGVMTAIINPYVYQFEDRRASIFEFAQIVLDNKGLIYRDKTSHKLIVDVNITSDQDETRINELAKHIIKGDYG